MLAGHLWIVTTLAAVAGQVTRNAMQRRLTETIGVVGATQVRFLFGLPFALLFLPVVLLWTGEALPRPSGPFWLYVVLGAAAQVVATALMLAAMRLRSFSVVTALVKTEPVQVAVFGLLVLGDRIGPAAVLGIAVATLGVSLVSWTPRVAGEAWRDGLRPILLGLAAGAGFALSAVWFRGAILALGTGGFLPRATTTLAASLAVQTLMLLVWLLAFDRPALLGSLRVWRTSLLAGFVGAATSQLWFVGFALTTSANVRTLGLVEVLMAQAVSGRLFGQRQGAQEIAGIALVVAGVLLLVWASG